MSTGNQENEASCSCWPKRARAVRKVAAHGHPQTIGLELGRWCVLQARSWVGLATTDSTSQEWVRQTSQEFFRALGILSSLVWWQMGLQHKWDLAWQGSGTAWRCAYRGDVCGRLSLQSWCHHRVGNVSFCSTFCWGSEKEQEGGRVEIRA